MDEDVEEVRASTLRWWSLATWNIRASWLWEAESWGGALSCFRRGLKIFSFLNCLLQGCCLVMIFVNIGDRQGTGEEY